ncbi:MAG: FAD-dependent oxidoreductase [Candidatus Electrothrix aestuarii]|uniref:FAD-dependent oxidoreductase n=1 Tax=Candidatus Electrothrix aestuarii TaxID=3062594 RepID=A0AAU8LYT7_9BACT|nr:FAD-dependent oxidoreductase [Candidatus Electrothrix aestuarii]
MADYQLIIIGGGLSGLAAGIRSARFGQKTLIVEQHALPGGLNSYYYRQGYLLETGLHAMTNYAGPETKHAPLNRLFRQLKLSRKKFITHEQLGSAVIFPQASLNFSNELELLCEEIARAFPASVDRFRAMSREVDAYDPFAEVPWQSARAFLHDRLAEPLLEDMLLLPLMVYGNAEEHDMDLGQFAIMFRAVFLEGFFRPEGTIKDLIDMLMAQYAQFGGEIRFRAPVDAILTRDEKVQGIRLESGEEITADAVLSTVGIPGTAKLSGWPLDIDRYVGRMTFMETISMIPELDLPQEKAGRTILFYSLNEKLRYHQPDDAIDPSWGVICFPDNFQGLEPKSEAPVQVRVTNAANYDLWQQAAADKEQYQQLKEKCGQLSTAAVSQILGTYNQGAVFQDSFTPMTIERFTEKRGGAVYGSPIKIKSGKTPFENLFIAGTDQGYLGIVGSMLSGVTIVNQHLLT